MSELETPELFNMAEVPHLCRVSDLLLDPLNPRLAEYASGFKIEEQESILALLAKNFHLTELFDSIIASDGFWMHEPLIVVATAGKKFVVVEGNRRLAAVKLLLKPDLASRIEYHGVPEIGSPLRTKLEKLPIVVTERRDAWEFVGFKHVNGAKVWDPIAKAEFIARVHEEYEIPLDEIAKTIGDRNSTVVRLYHGLKVLNQATSSGYFDPSRRYNQARQLAFSHLYTGLGYDGIRQFLALTDDDLIKREPVRKDKIRDLGKLCVWIYGDRGDAKVPAKEPYVKSQNPHLRQLDEALSSPAGIAALEAGRPLDRAVEAARGDEKLLRAALDQTMVGLRDARGYFATGFEGQEDFIQSIKAIWKNARALHQDLKIKTGEDDE